MLKVLWCLLILILKVWVWRIGNIISKAILKVSEIIFVIKLFHSFIILFHKLLIFLRNNLIFDFLIKLYLFGRIKLIFKICLGVIIKLIYRLLKDGINICTSNSSSLSYFLVVGLSLNQRWIMIKILEVSH